MKKLIRLTTILVLWCTMLFTASNASAQASAPDGASTADTRNTDDDDNSNWGWVGLLGLAGLLGLKGKDRDIDVRKTSTVNRP